MTDIVFLASFILYIDVVTPTSLAEGAGLSNRDLEGVTGSSVSLPQAPRQLARELQELKGDSSRLRTMITAATGG